jgi:hypothetical protein
LLIGKVRIEVFLKILHEIDEIFPVFLPQLIILGSIFPDYRQYLLSLIGRRIQNMQGPEYKPLGRRKAPDFFDVGIADLGRGEHAQGETYDQGTCQDQDDL